jgi:hypothetical protein
MTRPANLCQGTGAQLTLDGVEQPEFCPVWPPASTLAYEALKRLLSGERLTHPEFERHTSSWRLAAWIHDLREMGWPVETVEVVSAHGRSARTIAEYLLPPSVVERVANRGSGCHE